MQRKRTMTATAAAPRLLAGTPYEAVDLTGVPGSDLDYYVYELGRLQDVAREMIKVFDAPPDVVCALDVFDAAVPNLRAARNPLTHASDDARLDDVGWMSAVIRFGPSGQVTYLVDPRYDHHDAESLADALLKFLRAKLRP